LADAREGKKEVYFVDAAHFVWQGFLGFLWCFTKIWVKSPSGRQRFNVLGALNAVTKQTITITNTTYINAWSVIELLFKLRQRYLTTRVPITIILDNCGYQACNLVRVAARMMSIELIFLPSYSPNLNLIERLWKFVKKKSLYSQEFSCFEDFCSEIIRCIENAHIEHKDELESLLTWRFQTLPILSGSTLSKSLQQVA
jgi:transposase